jgi:hypothetical protein
VDNFRYELAAAGAALLDELELDPFDELELEELDEPELDEPELDEPELDESEEEDEDVPADSLLFAEPLDEALLAVFAASRLSVR